MASGWGGINSCMRWLHECRHENALWRDNEREPASGAKGEFRRPRRLSLNAVSERESGEWEDWDWSGGTLCGWRGVTFSSLKAGAWVVGASSSLSRRRDRYRGLVELVEELDSGPTVE